MIQRLLYGVRDGLFSSREKKKELRGQSMTGQATGLRTGLAAREAEN